MDAFHKENAENNFTSYQPVYFQSQTKFYFKKNVFENESSSLNYEELRLTLLWEYCKCGDWTQGRRRVEVFQEL